jgi:hypothetical protein
MRKEEVTPVEYKTINMVLTRYRELLEQSEAEEAENENYRF